MEESEICVTSLRIECSVQTSMHKNKDTLIFSRAYALLELVRSYLRHRPVLLLIGGHVF